MHSNLISVIVPVYNSRAYLSTCIESVIQQTYHHWEMILVDDGSTDDSGQICDNYAKLDSRIRVFHKRNAGVSSARNLGLTEAFGEYVLFLDADDWIAPTCIETCINYSLQYDLDCLQFSYLRVMDEHDIQVCQKGSISNVKNNCEYVSTENYLVCAAGSFINSAIIRIKHIRFNEDLKLAEDQIFMMTVIQHSERLLRLNEVLYFYRQNINSATHNQKSRDMLLSAYELSRVGNEMFSKHINSTISSFIVSMVVNGDVPCRHLRRLYNQIEWTPIKYGSRLLKMFTVLASVNFTIAFYFYRVLQYIKR